MADAKWIAKDGDMLDYICWKYYGSSSGYVENALESPKNYRLCDEPEILDAGTEVTLPEFTVVAPALTLWDDA